MTICEIQTENGSYDEVHCFVVADKERQDRTKDLLQERSRDSSMNMKIVGIHFVESIPRTALKKSKRFLLRKSIEENKNPIVNELVKTKPVSIRETIYSLIAKIANIEIDEINDNTRIFEELLIDSLGAIELELEIEKLFN